MAHWTASALLDAGTFFGANCRRGNAWHRSVADLHVGTGRNTSQLRCRIYACKRILVSRQSISLYLQGESIYAECRDPARLPLPMGAHCAERAPRLMLSSVFDLPQMSPGEDVLGVHPRCPSACPPRGDPGPSTARPRSNGSIRHCFTHEGAMRVDRKRAASLADRHGWHSLLDSVGTAYGGLVSRRAWLHRCYALPGIPQTRGDPSLDRSTA